MIKERNYEDDRQIDRNNLHAEFQRVPDCVGYWRKEYGKAKAALDGFIDRLPVLKAEAKKDLEVSLANIEQDLRENWGSLFDTKLTEKALASEVVLTEGYKKAWQVYTNKLEDLSQQLAKAVEDKEVLYGACASMESLQPVLHDLTKLYLNGYFDSKPNMPKELEEQTNVETKKRITKKLNRKKD